MDLPAFTESTLAIILIGILESFLRYNPLPKQGIEGEDTSPHLSIPLPYDLSSSLFQLVLLSRNHPSLHSQRARWIALQDRDLRSRCYVLFSSL